ncbi:lactose-binding lectin l-2-like [Symphorus nematophorus]
MLLFLFLFGLALGAESEVQSDDPAVEVVRGSCPDFWSSFNNTCYKYISTHFTWADAELHCVSEGANLVSIHTMEERNFIKALIKNFDPADGHTWIGLSDVHKEGKWMCFNGRCYKYVATHLTTAEAELYCVSERANLVSIHSLEE